MVVRPGARTFLSPNAPNPFHVSTRIEYALATDAHVELSIHDFFYEKVDVLVDLDQVVGSYSVLFTPGDRFPSGMYFITFRAGDYIEQRRMLYVR